MPWNLHFEFNTAIFVYVPECVLEHVPALLCYS
jgi:hypothetical protein